MIFRKMRTLISVNHALMLAYRAEIYLWVLASILPFIMMSIWMTAASQASTSANFSRSPVEYARYFIAVFAVRQFSLVWMIYEMEWYVVEGRLSYLLLRPFSVIWHWVAAHLAEQLARLPFFLVVVVIFFCIYPQALWHPSLMNIPTLLVVIITIYAAFTLRFALQYCLAMLTFWFERASSLEQLSFLPYLFLSGVIVPLADMPPAVRAVVQYTPFPYMIDFPASILTGQIPLTSPEILQGYAIMAAWFTLFALIGRLLWRRGLLQYSGQGA